MTVLFWEDAAGRTEFIAFDVVNSEGHEAPVDVTEFPVEEGAAITDHARAAPSRVQIEGYVSLKPMWSNPGVEQLASFRRVDLTFKRRAPHTARSVPLTYSSDPSISFSLNGLTKALQKAIRPLPRSYTGSAPAKFVEESLGVELLAFDSFINRCREIAEKLENCRLNARRIRLVTTLRDYDDMVIEREAEPRTADDGAGVTFQVDLKQIRTVRSQTVDAPKPAEARGAARESKGSKAAEKDANGEAKRAKLKSTSAQLYDSAVGNE